MAENRVVIYSNGIADFQRGYVVGAASPCRISLPVRQDHLGDVLASFNVYGDVTLDAPPTFRPSNEAEGTLQISPQNVLEDVATTLSGAQVQIDRAGGGMTGTLVGLHQEEEATSGEAVGIKSMMVLTDDGLRRCPLREIQSFQFLDDDVKAEFDKALRRNYQRIKPNSTFVELVLSTSAEQTDAVVQYTIPAAAWKISYRIRMSEGRNGELQGFAIVDNNTDEDWRDFSVCVVTGEPITFSTDLAESKSPSRKHVNLVSEMALGAVEVEESLAAAPEFAEPKLRRAASMRAMSAKSYLGAAESVMMDSARTESAEVHEVGDFNVFESAGSVSIPAQRSTVIPVFQTEIGETRSVLHYKHEDHPERPYRAIAFTNQTDFSLGRGVCTVFEQTTYVGNCIIPALKPGESRLLPHALETGVSVKRERQRRRSHVVALRLAGGYCYTSTRQEQATHYHIRNNRDAAYRLFLDHPWLLSQPELRASVLRGGVQSPLEPAEMLAAGARYTLELDPRSEIVVHIDEQHVEQSTVHLLQAARNTLESVNWLEQNLVATNGPLSHDPGVQACLAIKRELEAKRREIANVDQEMERLAARQERVRQNLLTGGQDELTSRWRAELDEAEQAFRTIEESRLPTLRDEEDAIQTRLDEALAALSAEWSGDAG